MYTSLKETSVYNSLCELSKNAFNLTEKNALNAKRIQKMQLKTNGLTYLYGTQRVDDNVLNALQKIADETNVTSQYAALMRGDVMNKIAGFESENRQVLHTSTRDIFDHLKSEFPSDSNAVNATKTELKKLNTFLNHIEESDFTDMILIGIGGSDLGPRAIYTALKMFKKANRNVHFISNVDPDDATAVLNGLNLSKTLVTIISKSGSTLETLTNEALVARHFEDAGLNINKHFLCVTGKNSPMDNPDKYLKSFYMFNFIGGRYSVTSMVGAVVLSFGLGYKNFEKFLRGARKMDINATEPDIQKNLSLLSALIGIWNRNFLNCETLAILPYSQAMSRFTAHLQQCDMESNGKRIHRDGEKTKTATGPIVWGEPGTNGQHAFYQLIHQSETIVPCEFIGFRKSQYEEDIEIQETTSQQKLLANLLAQSIGLATGTENENPNKTFPGNRPNSILMAEQLDPEVMGMLLAYFENRITFQGFIWNINSFDQEGVQLGKVLANELIENFKGNIADNASTGIALMKAAEVL